jgi:hypothetical protein
MLQLLQVRLKGARDVCIWPIATVRGTVHHDSY